MGLFNNFPYTDFHRLNLDWILKFTKSVRDRLDLIDAAVANAQAARDAAESYATNAENSASEAAASRDIAYQAASDAEDFKTAAQQSAGSALDSKTAAEAAQLAAQQAAQRATSSATAAGQSATAASQSATAAAGSASTARQSETAAAGSASTAQQSATAAQTAQTAAEAAQTSAETAAASVPSLQQMARRSNLSATRKLTVRSTYRAPDGTVINQSGMVVMKLPIDAWSSGMTAQDIGSYWHISEGFNFLPVKPFETGYYPDSPATLDINPNIIAIYYPRVDFLTAGGVITHAILYALLYDVHNGTYAADGETVHLELITNAFDMEHSQNDVITDITA